MDPNNIQVSTSTNTVASGASLSFAYAGPTTVTAGNLQVGAGGNGSTGLGATTVTAGATLSGTGTVNGLSNAAYSTGGTDITAGNAVITLSSAVGLQSGMSVTGPGIAGSKIVSVNVGSSTITLDTAPSVTTPGGGTINATSNHIVNGNLSPGDSGGTTPGTLTVTGNLTVGATSNMMLKTANPTGTYATPTDLTIGGANYQNALNNIAANAALTTGTGTGNSDLLVVTGTLNLNATGIVTVTNYGSTYAVGQVYNLEDWNAVNPNGFQTGGNIRLGGLIGNTNLPSLNNSNLEWDTSLFLSKGVFVVVEITAAPEPGRIILLLLGIISMMWHRRRKA